MFIILSGSSGVGKNTIIKKLEQDNANIKLMPTFTTRQKRETEVEGYPFYFLSNDEFQAKIKNNEFIEYEQIHNNYYGSSYHIFDEQLKLGKVLMKDLGVEGTQNLAEKLKGRTEILKIFITTKDKAELVRRLKQRKEKQIHLRLKRFGYEQKQRFKYDWIVLNNDLDETCKVLSAMINFKNKDFLPTIKAKKINIKKVTRYFNALKKGKILKKPVEVAISDGKPYIMKGMERFIAGLLAKKTVAKIVVYPKKIKQLGIQDYKDYFELIKKEI